MTSSKQDSATAFGRSAKKPRSPPAKVAGSTKPRREMAYLKALFQSTNRIIAVAKTRQSGPLLGVYQLAVQHLDDLGIYALRKESVTGEE